MDLSILVARILCLTYLSVGVGILLKNIDIEEISENFRTNPALTYLGGFMALIIGALLVMYHNIWQYDWRVLITIMGWLALIKGCALLAFPNLFQALQKKIVDSQMATRVWSLVVLALGLLFGYFGFLA